MLIYSVVVLRSNTAVVMGYHPSRRSADRQVRQLHRAGITRHGSGGKVVVRPVNSPLPPPAVVPCP